MHDTDSSSDASQRAYLLERKIRKHYPRRKRRVAPAQEVEGEVLLCSEIISIIGDILSADGYTETLLELCLANKNMYALLYRALVRRLEFRSNWNIWNFCEDGYSPLARCLRDESIPDPKNLPLDSKFKWVRHLKLHRFKNSWFQTLMPLCGPTLESFYINSDVDRRWNEIVSLCPNLRNLGKTVLCVTPLSGVIEIPPLVKEMKIELHGWGAWKTMSQVKQEMTIFANAANLESFEIKSPIWNGDTLDFSIVPEFAAKVTKLHAWRYVTGFEALINAKVVQIDSMSLDQIVAVAKGLPNPKTKLVVGRGSTFYEDVHTTFGFAEWRINALIEAIGQREVSFYWNTVPFGKWDNLEKMILPKCPNISEEFDKF